MKATLFPFILAGLLHGLVVAFLWDMPVAGDAADYLRDAKLLQEAGTTDLPVFYYPPGTSYWLVALSSFTGNLQNGRLFSGLMLVLVTVWLAQALAREVLPRGRMPITASIAAACYAPMLLLASQPYPQLLSQVCLGLTALCWLKALKPSDQHKFFGAPGPQGTCGCTKGIAGKGPVLQSFGALGELRQSGRAAACRAVAQRAKAEGVEKQNTEGRIQTVGPAVSGSSGDRRAEDGGQPSVIDDQSAVACGQLDRGTKHRESSVVDCGASQEAGARTPKRRVIRALYFALTGLALGYGALTRPASLSVGLALAVTGLYSFSRRAKDDRRERIHLVLGAGLCLLTAGLVVTPVLIHNCSGGAGLTLSVNNERNFWLGNNPYTPLYKTTHLAQRSLDVLSKQTRDYLESHYIREDIDDPVQRVARSRELRAKRMASAWGHIRNRPDIFLLRTVNRIRAFWGFDYLGSRQIQQWQGWSLKQAAPLYALEAGSYCLAVGLALAGIAGWRKEGRVQQAIIGDHSSVVIYEPGPRAEALKYSNAEGCESMVADRGSWQEAEVPRSRRIRWVVVLFILAYQVPYCFAFSAGTYHFPVMVLVFPLVALGIRVVHQQGVLATLRLKRVAIPLAVFILIQFEYAYFALKWM